MSLLGGSSCDGAGLRKGIAMDNTGRFLLGGALGAALGYLLSQKNLEKVQEGEEQLLPNPAFAVYAFYHLWCRRPR